MKSYLPSNKIYSIQTTRLHFFSSPGVQSGADPGFITGELRGGLVGTLGLQNNVAFPQNVAISELKTKSAFDHINKLICIILVDILNIINYYYH